MLVLGLHVDEFLRGRGASLRPRDLHAGAALVCDGRAVAQAWGPGDGDGGGPGDAGLPMAAARRCLATLRAGLSDVDAVAVDLSEPALDAALLEAALRDARRPHANARDWVGAALERHLGADVRARLRFVDRRQAQLRSAWLESRFEQAVCLVLDDDGAGAPGAAATGDASGMRSLLELPATASLADLVQLADDVLALQGQPPLLSHDLAGGVTAGACEALFDRACTRLGGGQLRVASEMERLEILREIVRGRHVALSGDPSRLRGEVATALRQAMLRAMRHVIAHLAELAPGRHLCLGGNVGVDAVFAGALVREAGPFDRVFAAGRSVGPGVALGAASLVAALGGDVPVGADHREATRIRDDVREDAPALAHWSALLEATPVADAALEAATALARGACVAWSPGDTETGRALAGPGADLVSRSLACTGLLLAREQLADLMEVDAARLPCAGTWLRWPLRADVPATLARLAAPDGTALVRLVAAAQEPLLHDLLCRVGEQAGVAALLQVSPFAGHGSPAADRADELASSLLCGAFDDVFVGRWRVRRTVPLDEVARYLDTLGASLAAGRRLCRSTTLHAVASFAIETPEPDGARVRVRPISRAAFELLADAAAATSAVPARDRLDVPHAGLPSSLRGELLALWRSGDLVLAPAAIDDGRRRDAVITES